MILFRSALFHAVLLTLTIAALTCPSTLPKALFCIITQGWLEGKAGGNPVYCDVRDVVDAHIAAAETPGASGRYMVTHTHSSDPKEVSDFLQVSPCPVWSQSRLC